MSVWCRLCRLCCAPSYSMVLPAAGESWMEQEVLQELQQTQLTWNTICSNPEHVSALTKEELDDVLAYANRMLEHQRIDFDQYKERVRTLDAAIHSNEELLPTTDDEALIQQLNTTIASLHTKINDHTQLLNQERAKLEPLIKLRQRIQEEFQSRA